MIDFRYFLVSIAAIFLALAVGVALGAGPLKGEFDQQLRANLDQMGKEKDGLRDEITQLEQVDKYRDTFASDVAPDLLKGRLTDQTVVLVALPDAEAATVKDLEETLTSAGATVTGTVQIKQKWAEPGQRQFLEDLAGRLVDGDPPSGDDASAYDRAGSVLARALVTKDDRSAGQTDDATPTIMGAFGEGGVVDGEVDLPQADLAVVVAPPVPDGAPTPKDTMNEAWLALMLSLDQASRGVVLAGDTSAASDPGIVASLRGDNQASGEVSSVDVADLPSGQVAVVWALVEQYAGGSGHYGAVGSNDGALPDPNDGT